jgi:hypothetical protein
MTPGIAADGGRLCVDCAGIPGDYTCVRCGAEGRRQRQGVCARCILTDRLRDLLDDGTGHPNEALAPLFEGLRCMDRPRSGLTWTGSQHVAQMLQALARGDVPLTHEGLDQLSPWRSVAYLRDLLMHHGVLPAVDRHVLLFGQWLTGHLAAVDDLKQRKLLEQYASWHVLRKLRGIAARQPVGASRDRNARRKMVKALEFLNWLAVRGHAPDECTQADLDAWHADYRIARRPTQEFLRWCMRNKGMPRLEIPVIPTCNPAPIDQHRRLALLRRFLTDDQLPLMDRVVATLLLLYAQPLSRIVRLTIDDVIHEDDGVLLRLGDPPTAVPEPFAGLLLAFLAARPNTTTATNAASTWLFPGRRAGQPIQSQTMGLRLNKLGFVPTNARTSAIRQLVLQAPPPVVAGMLGYHDETAARHAADAGGTWKSYAPGDHTL